VQELWWRDEDADHIRTRSHRYPGAFDIEPAWTLQAAADPHRIVRDPDPRSETGYARIIGYSTAAACVITVLADPEEGFGATAWKTRGADLRAYQRGKEDASDRNSGGT
jgi:hypothetical protein